MRGALLTAYGVVASAGAQLLESFFLSSSSWASSSASFISAAATSADSSHLDADSIAAFVENALPQASKLLYMEHIADCDRCRRILSQTVTLDRDESSDIAAAITPPIDQPIAETVCAVVQTVLYWVTS